MARNTFFFDKEDHDLLAMVNDILERGRRDFREQQIFAPELHPRGIKEMAVAHEILVAYSVINLLNSLEAGAASDRIRALRSLHDEVLYTATTTFRYNTGRVLIQIMKELVRAYGDEKRQLMLARDFRAASAGRRRVIRAMLKRYHLLEMPEEWNQMTFDNHVHDANTKGRKTPTHLIMDAWIKGIRQLTVIHYNFVEPRAVQELMEAADIMEINIRIGVEFKGQFRGSYIDFIWEPIGIDGTTDMVEFLEEESVRHLMRDGRSASAFMAQYVFRMLERYNSVHRDDLGKLFNIQLPTITMEEFLAFVATGQPSLEHLAELIYTQMYPRMLAILPGLKEKHVAGTEEEKAFIEAQVELMHGLHPELIMESYFTSAKNPNLPDPEVPGSSPDLPDFLKTPAQELVARLHAVRPMSRITLTLSGLRTEDALELIYDCNGGITHLELFNLKDFVTGKMPHYKPITELMYAINQGNPFALKRTIRGIIRDYSGPTPKETVERRKQLTDILRNIPKLQSFYRNDPLKTRVGSDSTSRSFRLHGMGFAFIETLPRSSRKTILDPKDFLRTTIPLRTDVVSIFTYSPPPERGLSHFKKTAEQFLRKLPGMRYFGYVRAHSWEPRNSTARYEEKSPSIATLGGFQRQASDRISLETAEEARPKLGAAYINTNMANVLKVLFGFFLTMGIFSFTQSWWVLVWFGAPIWFGITGLRNILQSVLGGGGIRRTPLLRWNSYVSWSRICDSLLYTGISVPLLELCLRWGLLGQVFNVTALDSPILFYTTISAANGLYIASHNLFRGLPKEAVIGNLFRSVLAIPLALLYNTILYHLIVFLTIPGGLEFLIAGSAIVSKAASDTVAGVIEGIGDQNTNLRMRNWDYTQKLSQLFACLARLEVLLPEEDVLELLREEKDKQPLYAAEIYRLQEALIIHSLDLMYFWMYQPRARTMLARIAREMTPNELKTFTQSQAILLRTKEISRMFVDGTVGTNFSKPLAFFLDRHAQYLSDITQLSGFSSMKG